MDDLAALASLQSRLGNHDASTASALRLWAALQQHPDAHASNPAAAKPLYEKLIAVVEKAGPQALLQHQDPLRLWKQKLQQLTSPVP
jgi:hypothetical protein